MENSTKRTEMTWERFLYEHSHPMAENLLREYHNLYKCQHFLLCLL